jgi:hypothetical protein
MCPLVLRQVAGRFKIIATRLADVRPLPRMVSHVFGQLAGPGERPVARLAYVRPLPRMGPQVLSQAVLRRKYTIARLTGVRLLPCMSPHVRCQVGEPDERPVARLADVRLLPRMGTHVNFQNAAFLERFPTGNPSIGINKRAGVFLLFGHSISLSLLSSAASAAGRIVKTLFTAHTFTAVQK